MKKLHALVVACAASACIPFAAQAADLVSAKFQTEDTFTPAFKSLPGNAAKPLFVVSGGSAKVQNGQLVLANGRFTVGAVSDEKGAITESDATTRPAGVLDLSKPYKITLKISEASSVRGGKDNFFIYVNNSTSKQAQSPLGSASQLLKVPAGTLKVGDNVFTGTVGDANSFLQIRAESGALVKIESITVGGL